MKKMINTEKEIRIIQYSNIVFTLRKTQTMKHEKHEDWLITSCGIIHVFSFHMTHVLMCLFAYFFIYIFIHMEWILCEV